MAEILKSSTLGNSKRRLLSTFPSPIVEEVGSHSKDSDIEISDDSKLKTSRRELELIFAEEISEIKETAYSDSFSKGYEEGKQAATEDFEIQKLKWENSIKQTGQVLDEKIEEIETLINAMKEGFSNALKSIEPFAVSIAYSALTQLLGQSEGYRERLAQQVGHAIDQFGRDMPKKILLNKSDMELLQSLEKLKPWMDKFISQESMERGGCIIEAGPRSLDASLIEQLNNFRQLLLRLDQSEE